MNWRKKKKTVDTHIQKHWNSTQNKKKWINKQKINFSIDWSIWLLMVAFMSCIQCQSFQSKIFSLDFIRYKQFHVQRFILPPFPSFSLSPSIKITEFMCELRKFVNVTIVLCAKSDYWIVKFHFSFFLGV